MSFYIFIHKHFNFKLASTLLTLAFINIEIVMHRQFKARSQGAAAVPQWG